MVDNKLQLGDVLFWKSEGRSWDRFIGLVSPGYSHVAFFVGDGEIIEARAFYGVRIAKIESVGAPAAAFRLPIPERRIVDGLHDCCFEHLGEKYSVMSGVWCGILRLLGLRKAADSVDPNWFCSEFVAYALRSGMGLNIMTGTAISDILPDDIFEILLGIGEQIHGPSLH